MFSSGCAVMKDTPEALHWLFKINYVEASIIASLQTIFGHNRSPLECEDSSIFCYFRYPEKILNEFDVTISFERALAISMTYSIVCRVLAYFMLKYRLRWNFGDQNNLLRNLLYENWEQNRTVNVCIVRWHWKLVSDRQDDDAAKQKTRFCTDYSNLSASSDTDVEKQIVLSNPPVTSITWKYFSFFVTKSRQFLM